jgi:transposase-like protein
MLCPDCRSECKRKGVDRYGHQRYQCKACKKTYQAPRKKPLRGMYLPVDKAEAILTLLLEGSSVSSVCRISGVHVATISKLLVIAGEKAEQIMATKIVNVRADDVQADEVWQFIGCKEKAKRPEHDPNWGTAERM